MMSEQWVVGVHLRERNSREDYSFKILVLTFVVSPASVSLYARGGEREIAGKDGKLV